jgi:hypothetical protein
MGNTIDNYADRKNYSQKDLIMIIWQFENGSKDARNEYKLLLYDTYRHKDYEYYWYLRYLRESVKRMISDNKLKKEENIK